MRVSKCIGCKDFPCTDVKHECYVVPDIEVTPNDISIATISVAAPANTGDYYYARGNPLFQQRTVQAFKDAGANVSSIRDLLDLGVYFTTAVKCGKTGYSIKSSTVRECSFILEKELALFPNLRILMLMGDVAIGALNSIAKRAGEERVMSLVPHTRSESRHIISRRRESFLHTCRPAPAFSSRRAKEE
jgi:hypothetical protein